MQEPVENNSLNKPANIPNFSPADPLDGRKLGDWHSIYNHPEAKQGIKFDAIYIVSLLFLTLLCMVMLWLDCPKHWLGISDQKYAPLLKYGMAWLSGTLGGTLFDLKWLYHSVARKIWHLDRRLWRLFAPHISGGLAFGIVAIISSGMFQIFDPHALKSLTTVISVAFLVGCFSDSAVAKLAEIADTLFGASSGKEKHRDKMPAISSGSSETAIAEEGSSGST